MDERLQQVALILSSLALALVVGLLTDLAVSWALGPAWASSLGLMAVLAGLFWSLANRENDQDP